MNMKPPPPLTHNKKLARTNIEKNLFSEQFENVLLETIENITEINICLCGSLRELRKSSY